MIHRQVQNLIGLLLTNSFKRKRFLLFHHFFLMERSSQRYVRKLLLFNTFFADQCTLINNNSTLPLFEYKVNCNFDNISFTEKEIIIIRSLNHNKAHWMGCHFYSYD